MISSSASPPSFSPPTSGLILKLFFSSFSIIFEQNCNEKCPQSPLFLLSPVGGEFCWFMKIDLWGALCMSCRNIQYPLLLQVHLTVNTWQTSTDKAYDGYKLFLECQCPPMWIHSTLTKGQRGLAYSYTFKVMLGGFTQGVVTNRTLLPRA